MSKPGYVVKAAEEPIGARTRWDDSVWNFARTIDVTHFRPEGSSHRPQVQARMLHSPTGLHGIFRVRDQFVRAVRTEFQGEVWKDSCVEFFVQPKESAGYFNFEMNCGGTLLCTYITDPTRLPGGALTRFVRLPWDLGQTVKISSTLPKRVDPEISEPTEWELCFTIPFAVLEAYVGPIGPVSGQQWRGNFFKCAEDVSHPHWASWSEVDEFNFHLPRCFGRLRFE